MGPTCQSLNQPFKNQAVMIAIYTSILFSTSSRGSHSSHTSLAAAITAIGVLLAALLGAYYLCRRQRTAA